MKITIILSGRLHYFCCVDIEKLECFQFFEFLSEQENKSVILNDSNFYYYIETLNNVYKYVFLYSIE